MNKNNIMLHSWSLAEMKCVCKNKMEADDNCMSILTRLYVSLYIITNLETFSKTNPVLTCPSYNDTTLCKRLISSLIKYKLNLSEGLYNCIFDCSFNVAMAAWCLGV